MDRKTIKEKERGLSLSTGRSLMKEFHLSVAAALEKQRMEGSYPTFIHQPNTSIGMAYQTCLDVPLLALLDQRNNVAQVKDLVKVSDLSLDVIELEMMKLDPDYAHNGMPEAIRSLKDRGVFFSTSDFTYLGDHENRFDIDLDVNHFNRVCGAQFIKTNKLVDCKPGIPAVMHFLSLMGLVSSFKVSAGAVSGTSRFKVHTSDDQKEFIFSAAKCRDHLLKYIFAALGGMHHDGGIPICSGISFISHMVPWVSKYKSLINIGCRITSPTLAPADIFKVNGLTMRSSLLAAKGSKLLSGLSEFTFGPSEMFADNLFSYCTSPSGFLTAAYLNCHHGMLDKVNSALARRKGPNTLQPGEKILLDCLWWTPLMQQMMIATSPFRPGLAFFADWKFKASALPSLGRGSSVNDAKRRLRLGNHLVLGSILSSS